LQLSSADINTSSFELHQILEKCIQIKFSSKVIPPEYARIEQNSSTLAFLQFCLYPPNIALHILQMLAVTSILVQYSYHLVQYSVLSKKANFQNQKIRFPEEKILFPSTINKKYYKHDYLCIVPLRFFKLAPDLCVHVQRKKFLQFLFLETSSHHVSGGSGPKSAQICLFASLLQKHMLKAPQLFIG
jgi:hypothetical protein